MPKPITAKAEDYALQMVLSGAESVIEDDLNEDGELDDEQHTRACEFGYALLHAIRYHRSTLLTTAREHYNSGSDKD
jgi:hypothetical protein